MYIIIQIKFLCKFTKKTRTKQNITDIILKEMRFLHFFSLSLQPL